MNKTLIHLLEEFQIWSNGIYECTLHRMINNSPTYHVSIAFFYEPNFDACIDPVNFCKEKVNGVATVEKAVYGEHLVKKVLTNFGMLITVLVLQEAIKGVVSEFEIPKGEDQSQPLYQFQWLYTNGLLAVIFSYGLVFTALKSRGARSWCYGTGWLRSFIADYGVPLMILVWSALSYVVPGKVPSGVPRRLFSPLPWDTNSLYHWTVAKDMIINSLKDRIEGCKRFYLLKYHHVVG